MRLVQAGKYKAIPIEALNEFGIVASAGLSSDLSFEKLMVENGFTVIGIDPSQHIADAVITEASQNKKFEGNFTLVRRIFSPASEPKKRVFTDESGRPWSTCDHFIGVCPSKFIQLPSIGHCELTNIYNNITLITVDIKGEEYKVLKSLQSIPFVCVKIYRNSTDYSDRRYDRALCAMKAHGYQVLSMVEEPEQKRVEFLFHLP